MFSHKLNAPFKAPTIISRGQTISTPKEGGSNHHDREVKNSNNHNNHNNYNGSNNQHQNYQQHQQHQRYDSYNNGQRSHASGSNSNNYSKPPAARLEQMDEYADFGTTGTKTKPMLSKEEKEEQGLDSSSNTSTSYVRKEGEASGRDRAHARVLQDRPEEGLRPEGQRVILSPGATSSEMNRRKERAMADEAEKRKERKDQFEKKKQYQEKAKKQQDKNVVAGLHGKLPIKKFGSVTTSVLAEGDDGDDDDDLEVQIIESRKNSSPKKQKQKQKEKSKSKRPTIPSSPHVELSSPSPSPETLKIPVKKRKEKVVTPSPSPPPPPPASPPPMSLMEAIAASKKEKKNKNRVKRIMKKKSLARRAKRLEEDGDLAENSPSEVDDGEDDDDDDDDSGDDIVIDSQTREESPDELLVSDEEAPDPSTLCPFCSKSLPTKPSKRLRNLKKYLLARPHIRSKPTARNPLGMHLPVIETASFCRKHVEERIIIPEGIKRGWPEKIDFAGLEKRIKTSCQTHLIHVISGEIESRFFVEAKREWENQKGTRKMNNILSEWGSFDIEQPGYYGTQGLEIMISTFRSIFQEEVPLLTSILCAPLDIPAYLRRVLVPECAVELIRLDLGEGTTREEAERICVESRSYGMAVFGNEEEDKFGMEESKREEREEREEEERRRVKLNEKLERNSKKLASGKKRKFEEDEKRLKEMESLQLQDSTTLASTSSGTKRVPKQKLAAMAMAEKKVQLNTTTTDSSPSTFKKNPTKPLNVSSNVDSNKSKPVWSTRMTGPDSDSEDNSDDNSDDEVIISSKKIKLSPKEERGKGKEKEREKKTLQKQEYVQIEDSD